MSTIVTRAGKGSPLTNTEVDANFTNLNTDKAELSGATFTGEIVADAGIALGDNDKATFGAGDDLQIYHDGSNSFIKDIGTGDLRIDAGEATIVSNTSGILNLYSSDYRIEAGVAFGDFRITAPRFRIFEDGNLNFQIDGGSVDLRYAGSSKLSTTSTGIDVTGTVVADGLTVAGPSTLTSGGTTLSIDRTGGSTALVELKQASVIRGYLGADSTKSLIVFNGSAAERFSVSNTGIDVTGTVVADGLTVQGTATTRPTIGNSDVNTSGLTTGLNFEPISNLTNGAKLNVISGLQPTVASAYTAGFEFVTEDHLGGGTFAQTKALTIGASGDISFYEDTGTTAKLVWSAANEDLNFADSVKATFGASDDLQIYHDGANSYIKDAGTGDLILNVNNFRLKNAADSEIYLYAQDGGGVNLYHTGNAIKLATTDTGIDVTGTATMDGLTVDGGLGNSLVNLTPSGTFSTVVSFANSASAFDIVSYGSGSASADNFRIRDNGASRLNIAGNGDISFYEDTGTTPKFFWDASAESLGIGTSSPAYKLNVAGDIIADGEGNTRSIGFDFYGALKYNLYMDGSTDADKMHIRKGTTNVATFDSSGNLLVGKSATAFNTHGVELRPNGAVWATVTGQGAASFNIKGTDGVIADFYKDGTSVGSIGSYVGTHLKIGSGTANVLFVNDTGILPSTSSGAASDGLIDLGGSDRRFKDLYLSGGVYLGGTGAANKLDDYETGTFTPNVNGVTLNTRTGTYTKIGNLVYIGIFLHWPSTTDNTDVYITGFPFACKNNNNSRAGLVVSYSTRTTVTNMLMQSNANYGTLRNLGGSIPTNADMSGRVLHIGGVYQA